MKWKRCAINCVKVVLSLWIDLFSRYRGNSSSHDEPPIPQKTQQSYEETPPDSSVLGLTVSRSSFNRSSGKNDWKMFDGHWYAHQHLERWINKEKSDGFIGDRISQEARYRQKKSVK